MLHKHVRREALRKGLSRTTSLMTHTLVDREPIVVLKGKHTMATELVWSQESVISRVPSGSSQLSTMNLVLKLDPGLELMDCVTMVPQTVLLNLTQPTREDPPRRALEPIRGHRNSLEALNEVLPSLGLGRRNPNQPGGEPTRLRWSVILKLDHLVPADHEVVPPLVNNVLKLAR